ncbi:acetylornithine deacetylase [Aureimonas endophytica]|uniref:Acetylornithine deacetylase n=1 Tax=Aureimonas endophytica TaxID=2027858 RepID=A0A916ZSC2_9HYPH|nr:ArgE/DapE family deacylase [Aureimonas endophytica]GGE11975.1 acetylornithine deacetylase [Aureimonas endophytica]
MPRPTPGPDGAALRTRLQAIIRDAAPRQIEWLRQLARFASTRGRDEACQRWLAEEFARRGWAIDRYRLAEVPMAGLPGHSPTVGADEDRLWQVVATPPAGAEGRSLILQGHIDVVPAGPLDQWEHDPFEPRVADGFITGRGVNDMKVGVAAMVFALDALAEAGFVPGGRVHVETVSEEECTGNGALSTLVRGYKADACLIPEVTDNRIVRAQLGSVWFRVRIKGRAAHVLETQKGESAILAAYRMIGALEAVAAHYNGIAHASPWYGDIERPIKLSVGKIAGGDWIGMVPSWCDLDCRMGVLPGTDLADVRGRIVAAVEADAAAHGSAAPGVEWIGFQAEGYVLEEGSEAEAALARAHRTVLGHELEPMVLQATSDIRQYGLYYNMPALCYGSCGSGSHTSGERTDLASMSETTLVLALFVAEWCGLVARGEPA